MTHGGRLGLWSAVTLAAVGVGYAVVLAAGMVRHGLGEPIGDPVLAVMEGLTLVSAPVIVALLVAIHDRAPTERKIFGVLAVAFGVAFAGLTSVVHFVELTAVRQMGGGGIVWPSASYAAELLAWDGFLGLALLSAGAALGGHERDDLTRRGLLLCGGLCLAGAIGPAVGNMRVQLIGVAGYALGLPVVALLLARLFAGDGRS